MEAVNSFLLQYCSVLVLVVVQVDFCQVIRVCVRRSFYSFIPTPLCLRK